MNIKFSYEQKQFLKSVAVFVGVYVGATVAMMGTVALIDRAANR